MGHDGFAEWMDTVERIGIREGVFDPPGSYVRRPYRGDDGAFRELYESGVPAGFAIGEALAMGAE